MGNIDLITYQEVLEKLGSNNNENHLLLGNGFNLSMGVNTSYKAIFEEMKTKYKGYKKLNSDDYDIESIIGELKEQISKDSSNKEFLEQFINNKVELF